MLPLAELVRHIRRRRNSLGLTQSQLASIAGSSQSFIAKLEKGAINPSYEAVRRIHLALEEHGQQEEPKAKDLMHEDPIVARGRETIGTVLERMKAHGFSQLPVLDGRFPVGAIRETDLLEHIEQGESIRELKRRKVSEVMRDSFPTVDPSTRRLTIVELLREQDAVLVVENGKVIGLITKSDLW